MTTDTGSAAAGTPAGDGAAAGTGGADGGAATTDWTAGLPEEDRGWIATKGYKAPADVVKAYRGAEKLIGRPVDSLVALPGENATDDDWNGIYAKLGRPQTADGYEFPSEGADEATDKAIRAAAHRAGLNQRQAEVFRQAAYENRQASLQAMQGQAQQRFADTKATMQREWGQAFEQKESQYSATMEFIAGDAETATKLQRALVQSGLVTKEFANRMVEFAAENLSEDQIHGKGSGFGAKSPAEAKAEIDGLMINAEFMKSYSDKTHPGFKAASARMQALFAAAYPER